MDATKILIVILTIGSVSAGGYFVWENYSKQEQLLVEIQDTESEKEENKTLPHDERDNERVADILTISKALKNYAEDHNDKYPETNGIEKISEENSATFNMLKSGNYLNQIYKDPLFDKFYYGYKSDGFTYELTTVLENKNNNNKCTVEGSG